MVSVPGVDLERQLQLAKLNIEATTDEIQDGSEETWVACGSESWPSSIALLDRGRCHVFDNALYPPLARRFASAFSWFGEPTDRGRDSGQVDGDLEPDRRSLRGNRRPNCRSGQSALGPVTRRVGLKLGEMMA
jgi:hypothetical protein